MSKLPRDSNCFGKIEKPWFGENGTWIEPESMTYPKGGLTRRCKAKNKETGKLVIVRCGISDTYWTIPCRGGGFLTIDDGEFIYYPQKQS